MDVDPDTMAAVAVEAWVMARAATLSAGNPKLAHEAAVGQALVDLRRKYPALGGTLRGMDAKEFL
jgi:nitrate reductase assembly molybdenum cofactor insertion protein NarJ